MESSNESSQSEDEDQLISPIELDNFSQEETLRESFNGVTYLIKNSETEELFIAKSTRETINGDKEDTFKDQISQIIHLNHPFILPFCSYSLTNFDDDEDYGTFITKHIPNAVSLKDVFTSHEKPLEWTPMKRYFTLLGIAYTMQYIHSNNIIHGNLKPGNILLDSDFNPIITDFCLTSNFSSSEQYDEDDDDSYKFEDDTPLYIAPELIDSLNDQEPQFSSDTYSYSLIAYELITGRKPFNFEHSGYNSYYQYAIHIKEQNIRPDTSIIKDWKIEQFFKDCWNSNPNKRTNFTRIIDELNNERYVTHFRLNPNSDDIKEYKKKLIESLTNKTDSEGETQRPIFLIQTSQKLYEYQLNESLFEWTKTVGEGSFAKVTKIVEKSTGIEFAGKQSKHSIGIDQQRDFFKEVELLFYINHPAVLEIYGFFFYKETIPVIVTKYMKNQSLKEIFEKNIDIPIEWTPTKRFINLIGIAYGIEYIHSLNIIHMDLKPGNILLDDDFYPKIADFGNSIINDKEKDIKEEMAKSNGTPIYSAPEFTICSSDSKIDPYKVDVFSFSMIAYELLTQQKPFLIEEKKIEDVLNLMNDMADRNLRPDLSIIASDEVKSFFEKCWETDPSQRFSSKEVVEELHLQKEIFMREFGHELNRDEIELYFEKVAKKRSPAEKYASSVKEAADRGDTFAAFKYADMLFNGHRVDVNKKEAAFYFKKAADDGNVDAMKQYIRMLRFGDGVDVNEKEALIYERILIDQLEIKNKIELGKDDVMNYFRSEADCGNVIAMNYLAEMLYDGDGISSNKEEAAKYFKMAADSFEKTEQQEENGNKTNNFNVNNNDHKNNDDFNKTKANNFTNNNEGSNQNNKNNNNTENDDNNLYNSTTNNNTHTNNSNNDENFNKSTNNNDENNNTANLNKSTNNNNENENFMNDQTILKEQDLTYTNSNKNTTTNDEEEAEEEEEPLKIEQNDEIETVFTPSSQLSIDSMVRYASMLSHGEGVHVNKRESARYLKKAADHGDIDACCKLGKVLFKGEGVRTNLQLAATYFNTAFDDDGDFVGNSDAMNFYGYMASNGLGMKCDKKKAAHLYKMASDQGNPFAMNNYGFMLSNGVELKVDKESAAKYYKLAADQGNKDAMINLGNMLYKGDGIQADLELAAYYYHMALNS